MDFKALHLGETWNTEAVPLELWIVSSATERRQGDLKSESLSDENSNICRLRTTCYPWWQLPVFPLQGWVAWRGDTFLQAQTLGGGGRVWTLLWNTVSSKVKKMKSTLELQPSKPPHCWPWLYSESLLGENINLFVRGEGRDGAASKDILLEAHK